MRRGKRRGQGCAVRVNQAGVVRVFIVQRVRHGAIDEGRHSRGRAEFVAQDAAGAAAADARKVDEGRRDLALRACCQGHAECVDQAVLDRGHRALRELVEAHAHRMARERERQVDVLTHLSVQC